MNRKVLIVVIVLALSVGIRIWVNATPIAPARQQLADFPQHVGEWSMVREDVLTDSIAGVLRADDYISRSYRADDGVPVDVFIAYYKVQKAGESMHSPKNCLPGWGWQIIKMERVPLFPDDPRHPAMINRYLIDKTGERALVYYWYQANGRMIASEYWGKVYMVWDALRTGRRDGAIVRFVVPIPKGANEAVLNENVLKLARQTVPLLPKYLPD